MATAAPAPLASLTSRSQAVARSLMPPRPWRAPVARARSRQPANGTPTRSLAHDVEAISVAHHRQGRAAPNRICLPDLIA
jgi:hypothetical protein